MPVPRNAAPEARLWTRWSRRISSSSKKVKGTRGSFILCSIGSIQTNSNVSAARTTILVGVLLIACLAGCVVGKSDDELVASQVKTFEDGDVEVSSCEKVGEAIARDSEYGASLYEAWQCDVRRLDDSESVESCYVVYNDVELGVIRELTCSSVGAGCPPGGRRLRNGEVFLGPIIDPDLVYERARGNEPPQRTVRVDVSYDGNGSSKRCGYLDVRMSLAAEDPLKLAAEHVEAHGWAEDRYSFAYGSLPDSR